MYYLYTFLALPPALPSAQLDPIVKPDQTMLLPGTLFFCLSLVTGPRRSLSLKLSETRVYEPQIRARLGTTPAYKGYLTHKKASPRRTPQKGYA